MERPLVRPPMSEYLYLEMLKYNLFGMIAISCEIWVLCKKMSPSNILFNKNSQYFLLFFKHFISYFCDVIIPFFHTRLIVTMKNLQHK